MSMNEPHEPIRQRIAPQMTLGLGTKLTYGLATVLFIGFAVAAARSALSARRHGTEASHIIEFLGAIGEAYAYVQEITTSQRGYLLTQDRDYLQPPHDTTWDTEGVLRELTNRAQRRAVIPEGYPAWEAKFFDHVRRAYQALGGVSAAAQPAGDSTPPAQAWGLDEEARRNLGALVRERREVDLKIMRQERDLAVADLVNAGAMGIGAGVLGVGILGASLFRIVRELRARRQLAEAMHQQGEEFRVTLLSIGEGVIATDEQQRVKAMNDRAEELTGWSAAVAIGQPLTQVLQLKNPDTETPGTNTPHANTTGESAAAQEGLSQGTHGSAVTANLIARDGTQRSISMTVSSVAHPDGTRLGMVLVFRDISQEQATQNALLEEQRRKDEFLAMLGHELRNPLAGILTGVQVLRMLRPEGDAAKMQEVIERQAVHMSRIVDDLLDISRFARGKLVLRYDAINLRKLIQTTVDDYCQSQLLPDCELKVELPDAEVWTWGDSTRIAQAVGNLIHNGCKFADGPNEVTVQLQLDESRQRAIITVRDRGIGMDAATLNHIFQPFMQADGSMDRSRGGLGLGLALVRGIVQLHGGQVLASSPGPGRGSVFQIELPRLDPDRSAPADSQPIVNQTALNSLNPRPSAECESVQSSAHRVLIIDDRRDAVVPLENMLRIDGHSVSTASTGEAGVATAMEFKPSIVLCDIGLTDGMDGYEVARAIRSKPELAHTYLVAVTGYGHEDDRVQARQAGFDFHLTKPVGKQQLNELIAHMPKF